MSLEKLIKYEDAILEPETELEVIENGSKIKLKPLENLILFSDFEKAKIPGLEYVGILSRPECPEETVFWGNLIYENESSAFTGKNSLYKDADNEGVYVYPPIGLGELDQFSIAFAVRCEQAWTTNDKWENLISLVNVQLQTKGTQQPDGDADIKIIAYDKNLTGYELIIEGIKLFGGEGDPFWQNYQWFNLVVNKNTIQLYHQGKTHWLEEEFDPVLIGEIIMEADIIKLSDVGFKDCIQISQLKTWEVFYFDAFIFKKTPEIIPAPVEVEENPPGSGNFAKIAEHLPQPYSSETPKAIVSLSTGFASTLWDLSSLSFFNEEVFENELVKIRIDCDDDNTPEFSGEPLTLDGVRALSDLTGKFLHLEFSFYSDGKTQRVLSSGKIGVKPSGYILLRRKPEILSRF